MNDDQKPTNLEQLIDRIRAAARDSDRVSVGDVMDVIGRRSFGPVLLVAGLITVAPLIGDIPGVPTIIGIFVFLVAIQLLLGRRHFWLPAWLLRRSVAKDRLHKALHWLRRPARFVDRFLRPRLTILVNGITTYAVALVCLIIALMMPPMEFIPFSANAAGAALTVFGLALIAHDGLLALIAFTLTAITVGVIFYNLL